MATLPELLHTLVQLNGSDLHITTQTPPQIRVHGKLQTLTLEPHTRPYAIWQLLAPGVSD